MDPFWIAFLCFWCLIAGVFLGAGLAGLWEKP